MSVILGKKYVKSLKKWKIVIEKVYWKECSELEKENRDMQIWRYLEVESIGLDSSIANCSS